VLVVLLLTIIDVNTDSVWRVEVTCSAVVLDSVVTLVAGDVALVVVLDSVVVVVAGDVDLVVVLDSVVVVVAGDVDLVVVLDSVVVVVAGDVDLVVLDLVVTMVARDVDSVVVVVVSVWMGGEVLLDRNSVDVVAGGSIPEERDAVLIKAPFPLHRKNLHPSVEVAPAWDMS